MMMTPFSQSMRFSVHARVPSTSSSSGVAWAPGVTRHAGARSRCAATMRAASTTPQAARKDRVVIEDYGHDDNMEDAALELLLDDSSALQPSTDSIHASNPSASPVPSSNTFLSTALTAEELEEVRRALTLPVQVVDAELAHAHNAASPQHEEDGILPDDDVDLQNADLDERERVFLVGVDIYGSSGGGSGAAGGGAEGRSQRTARRPPVSYSVHESLAELGRLADTAGLRVVGSTHQALEVPNGATYIGSGKVAEVARAVRALNADTVIFDCELAPGQLRNLERAFGGEQEVGVQVADRTALILDIFSQRAATREGKLQVELAQVEYQLPRLTRMWTHLDRVGGGGQVKGAGEKQIEMDKRLLRDRLAGLKRELESVRGQRRAYRERRALAPIPVVALVGYTNAGKSTLLNRLTDAGVLAEDKLFATLDPTTRRIRLKGNREVLLSDTVGFIQKLPTELVAAFRATLEEVQDAAVLLHLVDISHANAAAQCEAVLQVLDDLGVSHIPLVTAWNKLDACPDPEQVRKVAARRPGTVCVSGQTGEGLDALMELIATQLAASMTQVQLALPYSCGDLLDEIHRAGEVVGEVMYTDAGMSLCARVPPSLAGRLGPYTVDAPAADQERGLSSLIDDWDGAEAAFDFSSVAPQAVSPP